MRKSIREQLQEAKRDVQPQVTIQSFDELLTMMLGGPALPTQYRFIGDSTRLRAYKGPAGCAKTSTIVAAGLLRALFTPGSKGLIARHDYNDLMDTTALRAEEMLQRLPKGILIDRDKSPPMKWWIYPIGGNGSETPSQITFMGLKDTLGSYEFNWAILDEADEMDEMRVHEVNTRLRYKIPGVDTQAETMLAVAFNPPDKHHWLYTACTGKDFQDRKIKEPWLKLYEPLPNENVDNLPTNYYGELTKTLTEDMRQRLVDGEWGATFDGQPVIREFKYNVHVKDGLKFAGNRPLLRGWDFGYYRPYCVWAQLDFEGRLLHFYELLGHQMEATDFARRVKAITAERYPDAHEILDFGDPAVVQKKDTGQTLNVLRKEGITLRYRTAPIEQGLNLMRRTMNTMIDGEPAIQYERRGCPILIQALRGGYAYDEHGVKPVKDGFYDHPVDGDRYLVLNVLGGAYTGYLTTGQMGGSAGLHDLPTSVAYDPSMDPR